MTATKQSSSISENKMGVKNADIIYPVHLFENKKNRLFILCGGNTNASQIAGRIVCDAVQTYFHSFLEDNITIDFIEKAVRMAEINLSDFIKENANIQGFTTTLTLFYLADDGVYLAQIGESYVGQFRSNEWIYKTIDRSIDRKLYGTNKPVEINVVTLKDIRNDDRFFLCNNADISLEDEKIIATLMEMFPQTEGCLFEIKKYYQQKYNKPFSGHLIPIEQIREPQTMKQWLNSLVNSII